MLLDAGADMEIKDKVKFNNVYILLSLSVTLSILYNRMD
jgi:hypothetical protein